MSSEILRIPPKLIPVFTGAYRYRGAYGGRGSAKTRTFALMTAVQGVRFAEAGMTGVILCGREYMNSLSESSFAEVKAAIESVPWLRAYYEIGEKFIRTRNRRVSYAFAGLRHNLESIKSKANILLAWIDEAEPVSETAWGKLIPTVRGPGSEIWVTWNPESEESATHNRYRKDPPDNSCIVEMNWRDNPWFPEELEQERLDDLKKRPDTYDHIWEGGFYTVTEAQVFAGRVTIQEFGVEGLGDPLHGMDFGFARDPTTCVRNYVRDNRLYIRHALGKVGLEINHTRDFMLQTIPDLAKWPIRADSARPETISYLRNHGLPRIRGVRKWQGSVEDGVQHMKSYDKIIVHPSCAQTIGKEFRFYSYKVDPRTGDILPIIVDSWNHYIDACRYSLDPLIKSRSGSGTIGI